MRLDFLLCADHGFMMPCGVTLESLCCNNTDNEVYVHLISDSSLTSEDIKDLQHIVKRHNPQNQLAIYRVTEDMMASWEWYKATYYPKQVFYRLFCADLLPSTVDRVLYLDCDTIVRRSLEELWGIDMENHPVAATPDASELGQRLGFKGHDVYFNSGIMLINLRYWREHKCSALLFDYIDSHKEQIRLPDQDPLNIIFKNNKLHLGIAFNLQPIALYKDKYVTFPWQKYEAEFRKAQRNPAIIHYAGARPWEKGNQHPYKDEWFKYRAKTQWHDNPLAPSRVTIKTHAKDLLRMLLTPIGICHYVKDYYNRSLSLED